MAGYHGRKTLIDGSHVPLTSEEAEALWKSVEAAKQKRAETMPRVQDALSAMLDAKQRMQELGWWQGGGLRVRRGDQCAVAEFGSTGIWSGWVDDEGKYVHYCDSVTDKRRAWLKPLAELTDDERARMKECDEREALAFRAELDRLTPEDSSHG
jgi:hypothetical protein